MSPFPILTDIEDILRRARDLFLNVAAGHVDLTRDQAGRMALVVEAGEHLQR